MFVTFITIFFFSDRYSNLTTIEILVLLSWIPASKEFLLRILDEIGNTILGIITYRPVWAMAEELEPPPSLEEKLTLWEI